MSQKVDAFRVVVPQPLTQKDVTLLCPELAEGALVAQALVFPTETMNEITYYKDGRPLYTPSRTTVTAEWTCDFPDSTFTAIRYHLMSLLYSKMRFNVTLILGDARGLLSSVTAANPIALLRTAASNGVSALLSAQTLMGCWIKAVAPVDMTSAGATNPVQWRVTMRYNYIKPFINAL